MRVAFLHLEARSGEIEANRRRIERATELAGRGGARWVISGELVVSGYRFDRCAGTDWIEAQPDRWMRAYLQRCRDLRVVAFVSHPERDPRTGELFNSMFVGRGGRMLGRHRKVLPTPQAEDWCTPGTVARPVTVDARRVGMLVCADAYRPEPAAQLTRDGAQLIVSAAAWWPGEWGPNGEWEQRTVECDVPMLVCNRTGIDGSDDMRAAESVVVDRGCKLATLTSPTSAVFLVDLAFGSDGHIASCDVVDRQPV